MRAIWNCTITGGSPFVAHFPGRKRKHRLFRPLIAEVMAALESKSFRPFPWPADLTALTVCDRAGMGAELLREVFSRQGWPLVVVTMEDRQWENVLKLDGYRRALAGINTEYVLGLDGMDVLMMGSPASMLRIYQQRAAAEGTRLLFNAESNPWPEGMPCETLELSRAHGRLPFNFLNSGCWIGHSDHALRFYNLACDRGPVRQHKQSDQAVLKTFYHSLPWVDIDREASLFIALNRHAEHGALADCLKLECVR